MPSIEATHEPKGKAGRPPKVKAEPKAKAKVVVLAVGDQKERTRATRHKAMEKDRNIRSVNCV